MADINSNLPVADTSDGTPGSAVPSMAQQVGGTDGTNLRILSLDSTGKLNINNISGTISLPTGASTSALQTTGNTSLSSIDGKTPALGQAAMTASSPVVIASNQSAIPVTGTFFQATQPVSGPLTDTQLRATPVPVSGTFFQATQPVSGTVTANQGGTWTVQPGNTANTTPWLATINQGGNSATVTASNALKVDGSAVTQPISAASLPLPTGAATSALQTTGNTSLSSIDGKLTTKSGTLAVAPISNGGGTQSALTVGTTAVELKVGGSALTNRISATLCNNSLVSMFWGYTNAVTTSTGSPIAPQQSVSWDVGASTTIFVIAGTASNNARITEAAA